MTQPEYKEVEARMREMEAPEVPAGLAGRLKAEIPERPVVVPLDGADGAIDDAGSRSRRGVWLVAASVAVAVIGSSIAYRVSLSPQASTRARRAVSEAFPSTVQIEATSDPLSPSAFEPGVHPEASGEGRALAGASVGRVDEATTPDPTARGKGDAEKFVPLPQIASTNVDKGVKDQVSPLTAEVAQEEPERQLLGREPTMRRERQRQSLAAPAPISPSASRAIPAEPVPSASPPSTGGTAEPNDQPYGDTFFQSYGVNPFIDTEDDRLSTFAMDVDTGSYTMARAYIERGYLPPPEAIRVEEMVNFFDYGDAAPVSEEGPRQDFAIRAEGAPTPFGQGPAYRLLRFNVRGREVAAADRRAATLIFVVDISGSMNRENRLGLVRRSLGLLLDQLRDDDRVGLVVYGSRGRVLLEPTNDREAIRAAIERLYPQGSTNAEEGLVLAYDLAENHFRPGAINRLVLCSDGVANVGRTGPDSILTRIGSAAERGIELTAVGFGMGNYNDILMEQLADRGDGNYAYVDNLDEARRIFVENLTGTLQTIAREAKIQVEFNPEVVSRYRLLGYENRDVADERFRDDTVDAGEIGAGHSVTALYEIKLRDGAKKRAELATLRLRYQPADGGAVVESGQSLYLRDLAPSWERASAALRLASLVAEYAEILRHSFWAREGDLEDVFTRAQGVSAEFEGDIDVAELVGLVGKALRLAPPRD